MSGRPISDDDAFLCFQPIRIHRCYDFYVFDQSECSGQLIIYLFYVFDQSECSKQLIAPRGVDENHKDDTGTVVSTPPRVSADDRIVTDSTTICLD